MATPSSSINSTRLTYNPELNFLTDLEENVLIQLENYMKISEDDRINLNEHFFQINGTIARTHFDSGFYTDSTKQICHLSSRGKILHVALLLQSHKKIIQVIIDRFPEMVNSPLTVLNSRDDNQDSSCSSYFPLSIVALNKGNKKYSCDLFLDLLSKGSRLTANPATVTSPPFIPNDYPLAYTTINQTTIHIRAARNISAVHAVAYAGRTDIMEKIFELLFQKKSELNRYSQEIHDVTKINSNITDIIVQYLPYLIDPTVKSLASFQLRIENRAVHYKYPYCRNEQQYDRHFLANWSATDFEYINIQHLIQATSHLPDSCRIPELPESLDTVLLISRDILELHQSDYSESQRTIKYVSPLDEAQCFATENQEMIKLLETINPPQRNLPMPTENIVVDISNSQLQTQLQAQRTQRSFLDIFCCCLCKA